jgi:hypothetical protein
MIDPITIRLDCCQAEHEIHFRHADAPALPAHMFRKTIECQGCSSLVIVTMIKGLDGTQFEQEVI